MKKYHLIHTIVFIILISVLSIAALIDPNMTSFSVVETKSNAAIALVMVFILIILSVIIFAFFKFEGKK